MGPLRRGCPRCPAPSRVGSTTPLFPPNYFLPGCGARRARCKVGLCTWWGLCGEEGLIARAEESSRQRGGFKDPRRGPTLCWWEWNWANVLHSACAFLGVSFLFFFPEEKGLRKGHARAQRWVATLGRAASSWVLGGGGAQPPTRPALSCKRRPWRC